MQKEKTTIAIYNRKLATYLMCCGFILLDAQENKEKPEFRLYVFSDTPELKTAMKEFKDDEKFKEMLNLFHFKYKKE